MVDRLTLSSNFGTIHGALCLMGAFGAIIAAQLASASYQDNHDPSWLQWSNRVGYYVLAGALMWSYQVSSSSDWYPFRPGVVTLAAADLVVWLRVLTLNLAIKRQKRGDHGPRHLTDEQFFKELQRRPSAWREAHARDDRPHLHH